MSKAVIKYHRIIDFYLNMKKAFTINHYGLAIQTLQHYILSLFKTCAEQLQLRPMRCLHSFNNFHFHLFV